MRKSKIIITLLAILLAMSAAAQKRKAPARKPIPKPAPVVELSKEEQKFEEMLESTQQIMFIDSVVVDKTQFLDCYKMSTEAGVITGFNQFFKSEEQPYSIVYVNQLGNKCWYANSGKLYTSDLLGGQWSEPSPLD